MMKKIFAGAIFSMSFRAPSKTANPGISRFPEVQIATIWGLVLSDNPD